MSSTLPPMDHARTVGEVMTANPISIAETASLAEAAGILDGHKISGLPVIDEVGALVGVLSQTDLIRVRADQHHAANWRGLAVGEVMTRPALTIAVTATLDEAARQMDERRVHRLVVTNQAATPIGIISTGDLAGSGSR
jgi:CBS domain-containing protein